MEKRNIVLITWDSVRADHCSCYGYKRDTTPFLDKIARRGMKFENAIVSGVPTIVSSFAMVTSDFCPISFSASNTSQDSWVWRKAISKRKTIFEVLSSYGYRTGIFTPHPFFSSYYGFTRGCQFEYSDFLNRGKINKIERLLYMIFGKLGIVSSVKFMRNFLSGNKGYVMIENYYQEIVKWVDKVNNMKSYFLWIFMIDTHYPYLPPKEFAYSKKRRKSLWIQYKKIRKVISTCKSPRLTEDEKRIVIDSYDGEIRHADATLKQLWDDLKGTDPILIINADHGEAFGEHGFYGHPPEHYEYLIRVPLVIYNADIKGVVEEPVSLLRLAPTICELAGVENEFSWPSLLEDVEYTPPIVENKLENGLRVTVRDKEWKLIVNPDREDELYNIKKDPMEQENLIGQEPDVEKELRKLAEKHIKTRKEKERLRKRIKRLRGI